MEGAGRGGGEKAGGNASIPSPVHALVSSHFPPPSFPIPFKPSFLLLHSFHLFPFTPSSALPAQPAPLPPTSPEPISPTHICPAHPTGRPLIMVLFCISVREISSKDTSPPGLNGPQCHLGGEGEDGGGGGLKIGEG